jgi:hypothetical protein
LLVKNYDEVSAFLHDVGLGSTLTEEPRSENPPAHSDDTTTGQPCWPSELQQVLLRAALADAEWDSVRESVPAKHCLVVYLYFPE